MKALKHIGQLNEKVLVFGGAYSNLQALQEMKTIADKSGIPASNIICTGDVVGYCAEPEACLQFVKAWGVHAILGNVEQQLRDNEEDCGCNFSESSRCDLLSKSWYPFALSSVSDEMKEWLHSWPEYLTFDHAGNQAIVVHGSYFDTSEFIFKSTPWEIKQRNFKESAANLILSGHCGLPFSDLKNDNLWLNAGVIGMPANDGTSRVWYVIMDDHDGFSFAHQSFEYDHKKTAELMRENHLPEGYAKTLSTGLWDNMEILPEQERSLQGKAIELL